MAMLWFAAIPIWIFLWVAAGSLLTRSLDLSAWWSLPIWMATFVPGIFVMAFGILGFVVIGLGVSVPPLPFPHQ